MQARGNVDRTVGALAGTFDGRIWNPESRIPDPESRTASPEPRIPSSESSIFVLGERFTPPVALFDLFDLLLAHPEVVADLVNERLPDNGTDFVFVLAVLFNGLLEERDAIGKLIAVLPRALGQRRALIQAIQRVGRFNLHLIEQLGARRVFDDERKVFDLATETLGDEGNCLNEQTFELGASHDSSLRPSSALACVLVLW